MNNELPEDILNLEEYFDFSSGVGIENAVVKDWIAKCVDSAITKLNTSQSKEAFSTTSSGNTKVIVEAYRQDDAKATIHVSVCYNRLSQTVINHPLPDKLLSATKKAITLSDK